MARVLTINGPLLVQQRKALGLTQQALAESARLTTARLRALEKGGANTKLSTVASLAECLGSHPFDLLEWTE
jgi:predicted transcriptional regulator